MLQEVWEEREILDEVDREKCTCDVSEVYV